MKKSCIHIYCGDGKGKSTCVTGLAVRAAGFGKKVVLCQFLKDGTSSELSILRGIPLITVLTCDENFGFSWKMTNEKKLKAHEAYQHLFDKAVEEAVSQEAFLLVMDEFMSAYNYGMIDKDKALDFLKNKPEWLEVAVTGRDPKPELIELADYVSEIKKVKHPFDEGIHARKGIEF